MPNFLATLYESWSHYYLIPLLWGVLFVLMIVGAIMNWNKSIPELKPSFFFWLGCGYLALLFLIASVYLFCTDQPSVIGGILPVAVPWFGALGAVTISLEGVFMLNKQWEDRFNYWHMARPLFGAVLGTVAFFLFVLTLNAAGNKPGFLNRPSEESKTATEREKSQPTKTEAAKAGPTQTTPTVPTETKGTPAAAEQSEAKTDEATTGKGKTESPKTDQRKIKETKTNGAAADTLAKPSAPIDFVIYYVLAFLVGYREETFRELIKRATDVIMGPGKVSPAAAVPVVEFLIGGKGQPKLDFGEVNLNAPKSESVDIRVTGDVPLGGPLLVVAGEGFRIIEDDVSHKGDLLPNQPRRVKIEFKPTEAKTYEGTLKVAGTNLLVRSFALLGKGK